MPLGELRSRDAPGFRRSLFSNTQNRATRPIVTTRSRARLARRRGRPRLDLLGRQGPLQRLHHKPLQSRNFNGRARKRRARACRHRSRRNRRWQNRSRCGLRFHGCGTQLHMQASRWRTRTTRPPEPTRRRLPLARYPKLQGKQSRVQQNADHQCPKNRKVLPMPQSPSHRARIKNSQTPPPELPKEKPLRQTRG